VASTSGMVTGTSHYLGGTLDRVCYERARNGLGAVRLGLILATRRAAVMGHRWWRVVGRIDEFCHRLRIPAKSLCDAYDRHLLSL
jgi:hypothetical protein